MRQEPQTDAEIIYLLELIGNKVADETFKNIGRVHDWRNYVDGNVQNIWTHLSLLAKGIIYNTCQDIADKETWG